MKIAFYSPYLDTAGGGEKYLLTAAESLANLHTVDILLDDHLVSIGQSKIQEKIKLLHEIDLTHCNFTKAPLGKNGSTKDRFVFFKKYDLVFYLTDGSVFYNSSKRGIIHFQVPFKSLKSNIWETFKAKSWDLAVYNSKFTREVVEKYWPTKGVVVYPPVDVEWIKPKLKLKQIISVGRFFGFLRTKKQEVLIQAFKEMVDKGELEGWELNLAGGCSSGDEEYLNELKRQAEGYKINFFPNIEKKRLIKLYAKASVYWHAAGYKESEPEKMEHFGITVVEAMAAGCVPVVVNAGGLPEIVDERENGFLWETLDQLKEYTKELIKDKKLLEKMQKNAIEKSKNFSKKIFIEKILSLIEPL